jgi:hypothetical protein
MPRLDLDHTSHRPRTTPHRRGSPRPDPGALSGLPTGVSFPTGIGGAAALAKDKVFANAGAVVAGRAAYDHVHGWGEDPPFKMPVFVPTHRRLVHGVSISLVPRLVEGTVATQITIDPERRPEEILDLPLGCRAVDSR